MSASRETSRLLPDDEKKGALPNCLNNFTLTSKLWKHSTNSFFSCCYDDKAVTYRDSITGQHTTEAGYVCFVSNYFFCIPQIASTALCVTATPFTLFADGTRVATKAFAPAIQQMESSHVPK